MKVVYFNHEDGWPVGEGLFYHCKTCDKTIPSQPPRSSGCECGNIYIDMGAARVAVKRPYDIELLEEE